jgi:hypothetical protein
MKTNAPIKSIIKAVETVSNEKFGGNVVFANKPKDVTKYVRRFTLRTKDVNGPGSMVTKVGQRQPKANWDVQQAVMNEILRINPDPSIYVDTVYGRKFASGETTVEAPQPDKEEVQAELETVEETSSVSNSVASSAPQPRQKRKYTRRIHKTEEKPTGRKRPKVINGKAKLLKALKHLLKHPELLD